MSRGIYINRGSGEKLVKNREKGRENEEKIGEKEEKSGRKGKKSGRFFHFAPSDR